MRIALLSDAHGNAPALALCLRRLETLAVDRTYFLGDAIGYLSGSRKVLNLLRRAGVICQKGNHEAMLLRQIPIDPERERVYRLESVRRQLSAVDKRFVKSWPDRRAITVAGKRLLLVHGSPHDYLQGYVYPDTDLAIFDGLDYDAIFLGHTHHPFITNRQGKLVVNVGSCGLPRDQGNLLAFAVYDAAAHTCSVFRIQLEPAAIAAQFRTKGVAEEVCSVFSRSAAKAPFGQRIE